MRAARKRLLDPVCAELTSPVCPRNTMLLDYLSSLRQHLRWDGKAEGLSGLEVEDEVELARPGHRHLGGVGAAQHAVHVVGGAAEQRLLARRVGEQCAVGHERLSAG